MSHTAVISLANRYSDKLLTCNDITDKVNEIKKTVKIKSTLNDALNEALTKVEELKSRINSLQKSSVNVNAVYELDREVDTSLKQIENIKNNFNFTQNLIENLDEVNNDNVIINAISKHGHLGVIAIQQLVEGNKPITSDSIISTIKNINEGNKKAEYKQLIIKKIKERLNESDFAVGVKEALYNQCVNTNDLHDLAEFSAYIASKEDATKRIKSLFIGEINNSIKEAKFNLVRTKFVIAEDGMLNLLAEYKKQPQGSVKIKIAEDLKITYKMGDEYKGHICFKEAEQIIKNIKKYRDILSIKLVRSIPDSQETFKTFKERALGT